MSRATDGADVTLGQLMHFLCDHLPPSWELAVRFFRDEAVIELTDPEGEEVDICRDDMTTTEVILGLLYKARKAEHLPGLEPAWASLATDDDD